MIYLLGFETARLLEMFSFEFFRSTVREERKEKEESSCRIRLIESSIVRWCLRHDRPKWPIKFIRLTKGIERILNIRKNRRKRNEWNSNGPVWTKRRSGLSGNNEYDMTVYQSHIKKKRKKPPETGFLVRSGRPKFKSAGKVLYRDKLEIQLNN